MILALLAAGMVAAAAAAPQPQKLDEPIAIISYTNDLTPDGGYVWSYETANGIKANEKGTLKQTSDPENPQVIVAEGAYSYTSPEGVPINIQYVATDDGGFVATGEAIPTSPPIPPAIQRALDYIASHPPAPEGPGRGRRRR
ncbi:endocuticle structural glycoprotein ABD-4-like [Bacillus rossius redtenbacheri]|uniref:endocuticle structural glycoprotein ABD-4-like n=1 Tax=Bacillus rossius redtenbacheri TaxID=93214 RepID=UPI002FDD116B